MSVSHMGWAPGSMVAGLGPVRVEKGQHECGHSVSQPQTRCHWVGSSDPRVRSQHKGVSFPPAYVPPSLAPLGSRCAHSSQAWTILTGIWNLRVFHCTEPGFRYLVTRTGTKLSLLNGGGVTLTSFGVRQINLSSFWISEAQCPHLPHLGGSQLPSTDKLQALVKEEQFSFYLSRFFGWLTYQIKIRPINRRETNLILYVQKSQRYEALRQSGNGGLHTILS